MNQSILFPDQQEYCDTLKAVGFPAQQNGALIQCWTTLAWLEKFAGRDLSQEADMLTVFADARFDIEELAEEAIEDEQFDSNGHVWIDDA